MRTEVKGCKTGNKSTRATHRTCFYRCHLKAAKSTFSLEKVDYTNIIRATSEEHALGCFLAQFRLIYPTYAVVVGTILVSRVFPPKAKH